MPLHHRANSAEQRTAVRNRYRKGRAAAGAQVAALQQEAAFLAEARQWYARGYKDWLLVSAIANTMANEILRERDLFPKPGQPPPPPIPADFIFEASKGRVMPTALFIGEHFKRMMTMFELAALGSYELRPRAPYLEPEKVQAFLRDRLNFYDFDYEHAPLFGDPLGNWPEL